MKLLTLNCHSWLEEEQLEKMSYLAEVIHDKQYDVIALQEVNQSIAAPIISGNIRKDNFGKLLLDELEKLGSTEYQLIWDFSHIGYDIYEEGLAILTKCPMIEAHNFFISKSEDTTFWKTRKIVGATVEYDGKPHRFFSCHLGWWEDEEEPFSYQVNSLMEHVNEDICTFLMGDFNNAAHERDKGYDELCKRGLYDTYQLAKDKDSGITVEGEIAGWDENKHDLRIDLIFANQAVDVSSSQVIFNGVNKKIISDHYGVEVIVNEKQEEK